jgi:UDP-N-acetylmuramoyl-tripeptide--D-alanyl-D-alanine ligase
VVVPDVLAALATLTRHLMSRLPGLTVIGLTGSQGKTSTKDMLAEILGSVGPTVAPEGSFNTEIGVPLTAMRVTPDTRFFVVEMGARGAGHIAYLADLVSPSVGLVLNVGMAHLGEFGSRDNIAQAKGELVEALPATGLAVLNADDERVAAMAARTAARVLTFGTSRRADLRVSGVGLDDEGHTRMSLSWASIKVNLTLRYIGQHHAMNAAAAVAVALGCGLDLDVVVDALERAAPRSKWRMEVSTTPQGVLVINDAYNANPDSMRAALRALADIAKRRGSERVVAVLGDMRELGAAGPDEHRGVGRFAAATGVDLLVTVGLGAEAIGHGAAAESGWRGEVHHVADTDDALTLLRGELRGGDTVLVKASRAAGLEGLAATLAAGGQPAVTGVEGAGTP